MIISKFEKIQITFLEFFEILISCAAKSFSKTRNKEDLNNTISESNRNTISESKDASQAEELIINSSEKKSEDKITTGFDWIIKA